MKKLQALYFKLLPLVAHFRFFTRLKALLTAAGDDLKAAVAPQLPEFNDWLAKEDAVTDWVRKSAFTKKIAGADAEVDRILVGINAIVQTGLHSSMSAIRESAEHVHDMLKNYGNVTRESYDEEAGDVAKLLEQFTGPYAQDVANLGLAMWVQQLQTAFNTFDSLLHQREAEQGEKPPYTAEEVRKGIEGVYYRMKDIINANAGAGTSNDFTAFIDLLNPEIDHLNAEFHRVVKDLSAHGHCVIEPVATQVYTGKAVTPLTKVWYREEDKPTVELVFAKDFSVTYKSNVEVGMAEVTIHGKGGYRGQVTVKFNIARQPLPTDNE
jgi:hypothetical protein